MLITVIGGIIGIITGYLFSLLMRLAFSLPTVVPLWAVFAGLTLCILVGITSGIYPAAKAARLDPIVALRYE